MAKGKRELLIEVLGEQMSYINFKKYLEENIRSAGIKTTESVKMYFNIEEKAVYAVADTGKQVKISF